MLQIQKFGKCCRNNICFEMHQVPIYPEYRVTKLEIKLRQHLTSKIDEINLFLENPLDYFLTIK
jgi:hypothetical protein